MKTIFTFLILACAFQLSAQITPLTEKTNFQDKNGFNLQYNTSTGISLNFEQKILQKKKYSLWATAGLHSKLPWFGRFDLENQTQIVAPGTFNAELSLSNRWHFNQSHSIQLDAGIARTQFYNPRLKQFAQTQGFEPLSKYLSLEYRFQPKNSRFFFTAGYQHNWSGKSNFGGLNLGVGFKF